VCSSDLELREAVLRDAEPAGGATDAS